jgi:hypothetical protein
MSAKSSKNGKVGMPSFGVGSRRALLGAAGLTAIALVLTVSAKASPSYHFTSFDGPGDSAGGTTVDGISNNGYTVGFSSNASGTVLTNFIRNPAGAFTILNTAGDPLAMANGVNKSLSVVGGFSSGAAFETVTSFPTQLPAVNGTTTFQTAFGINDGGSIVGQYTDSSTGTTPGFLLHNGTYTTLNPVANAEVTNAQSINDKGLVAGFYATDGVHDHGFLYNSVTNTFSLAPDPNIPNLVLTQFLGINDEGIVSGYYQLPDGSQHGLLYNSNTQTYSFLDDPNAALSGMSITQITGINDAGDIAGFYVDPATGLQTGFIATPTATVPEPATIGLIIGALVQMTGFGFWRKRRGLGWWPVGWSR